MLIFACNEYSPEECKEYLETFVDIVINGDYEASMTSSQLIDDFPEPFEWDDKLLDKVENDLKVALRKDSDNNEFIQEVLRLFKQ